MKTPREILSERHQSAEPKLDVLRQSFLSEHVPAPTVKATRADSANSRPSLVDKLWVELIAPYRRVWIGLAAVWLIIIGLNFVTSGGTTQTALAKISPPTPEVLTELKEQKQMMAQLLGPVASSPALPGVPGPRSERREETYAV